MTENSVVKFIVTFSPETLEVWW